MRALLREFCSDNRGATAIEYGLIVAVLSLAIVGGVSVVANAIQYLFGSTESALIEAFHK